jgi:hypothetical protein
MSRHLEEILGPIDERRAKEASEIEEIERQTEQLTDSSRDDLAALQKAILEGQESTGSSLEDGVIVLYGSGLADNPDIYSRYKRVAGQLTGSIGELAVVMHSWVEDSEHICFGGDGRLPRQHINRVMSLGVLSGEEIVFDSEEQETHTPASAYLPSERFAYRPYSFTREVELREGGIPVDTRAWFREEVPSLGRQLDVELDLSTGNVTTINHEELPIKITEILIGRQAIQEWLQGRGDHSMTHNGDLANMRDCCEALGIQRIEPATDEQRRYLRY